MVEKWLKASSAAINDLSRVDEQLLPRSAPRFLLPNCFVLGRYDDVVSVMFTTKVQFLPLSLLDKCFADALISLKQKGNKEGFCPGIELDQHYGVQGVQELAGHIATKLSPLDYSPTMEGKQMFSWAVTFLVVAIVAAVFGFSGIAGTATNIAWILFVVGLILFIVFTVIGRRPPA